MIPTVLLVVFGLAILLGSRRAMWQMALVSLPGTVAHELSHLLMGALLFAKPVSISLIPRREGRLLVLGSVSFRNIGLINGAFVAYAPLLLAPMGYLCVLQATAAWAALDLTRWALWSVLASNLFFSALPSWQDIKVGFPSLVMYALLGVVVVGLLGRL